jgi:peptide-methionine (S)-S-oxide reductase
VKGPRALLPIAAFAALFLQPASAAERLVPAPPAERVAREPAGLRQALFAGGCFWGIEGVFSHVKGVTSAVSGYHGGTKADARYDLVSQGETAHAETVRVVYDPQVVRYDQLLRIFFSVIDPTQMNRQGPDRGPQYRTAVIPLSAEQRQVASAYVAQLRASGLWRRIATRIETHRRFYPAEARHQDFMAVNPDNPYIVRWDLPKLQVLRSRFPAFYRQDFTRD